MEKSGELVNFTLILLSINITNFLQNKQWSSNIEQGKISNMFVVLVVINLIFLEPLARMSWFICCFPVCLSKLSHLSMMCMAWNVMISHTMHLTNIKMPSPISNSTQANWVAQTVLPFFNDIIILMLFLGWTFNTTCICGIETQVDCCFKWTHTTCLHQIKRNHDWHIKWTMLWRRCAINGCDWDLIENNTFAIHSIQLQNNTLTLKVVGNFNGPMNTTYHPKSSAPNDHPLPRPPLTPLKCVPPQNPYTKH